MNAAYAVDDQKWWQRKRKVRTKNRKINARACVSEGIGGWGWPLGISRVKRAREMSMSKKNYDMQRRVMMMVSLVSLSSCCQRNKPNIPGRRSANLQERKQRGEKKKKKTRTTVRPFKFERHFWFPRLDSIENGVCLPMRMYSTKGETWGQLEQKKWITGQGFCKRSFVIHLFISAGAKGEPREIERKRERDKVWWKKRTTHHFRESWVSEPTSRDW